MPVSLGRILVVGGCGFVGQKIVQELFRRDPSAEVSVLDIRADGPQHNAVSYYAADITQKDQVKAVFNKVKPKTVLHSVSAHALFASRELLDKINILGLENVVACAQDVGVAAFVYTSSSSVVHDHRSPIRDATETAPLLFEPDQPEYYSHTKAVGEKLVLDANRVRGMLTTSIRPASIYGEGDLLMTANLFVKAPKAKFQFGNGTNLMDCTYVENIALAEALAAEALVKASASKTPLPESQRVEGEAFFVRDEERYGWWEFTRMAAKFAGQPVRDEDIRSIPRWLMMTIAFVSQWILWVLTFGRKTPVLTTRVVRLVTMDRTFCIDKIKKRLGYQARVTTEVGLKRAIEWYKHEVHEKQKIT